MAVGIFVVPIENNSPVWPNHDNADGARVINSCSVVGQGPIIGTWLGRIETVTDADMTALKSDARFLFVEDVVEEVP